MLGRRRYPCRRPDRRVKVLLVDLLVSADEVDVNDMLSTMPRTGVLRKIK